MENINDDERIKKLSSFTICKDFHGLVGDPKSTKMLRSGQILIEAKSAKESRQLLGIHSFVNITVKVTPHRSVNSCKEVIRFLSLKYPTEKEILHGLRDLHVPEVHWIKFRKDALLQDTNTFVLSFAHPT